MLVTPYLPNDAVILAKAWVRDHQKPVFVMAYDQCTDPLLHIPTCPNCNGVGHVFLKFANGGPYPTVTSSAMVVTWYEGDGQYGKGWYTIERTDEFTCPKCRGKPYDPGPLVSMPIDITAVISNIGR